MSPSFFILNLRLLDHSGSEVPAQIFRSSSIHLAPPQPPGHRSRGRAALPSAPITGPGAKGSCCRPEPCSVCSALRASLEQGQSVFKAASSARIRPLRIRRQQRNGNSQAVRIPAELAYERSDLELEIERCGDELRIRPAGRPITGALEALTAFSPSFLAEGREQDQQQERESL